MPEELLQDEEMRDSSEEQADESLFQFQQLYIIVYRHLLRDPPVPSIYRIDVSSCASSDSNSSIQSLDPILDLDDDADDVKFPALAILGHTLYLFGGLHDPSTLKAYKGFSGIYWGSEVRKYDLKAASNSKTLLKTSSLPLETFKMKGRKLYPQAVVIDETRICVFSIALHDVPTDDSAQPFERPSFELFDTISETWKSLPEPMKYGPSDCCYIRSYYTGPSSLTIYITSGYSYLSASCYLIKFDVPNPTWVKLDANPFVPDYPQLAVSHGIFLDINKPHSLVLVNPLEVLRWKDFARPYPSKLKADKGRKPLRVGSYFDGLCLKDGLIFVVRIGFEVLNGENPHLLVDTYKNDSEFESNLSQSKEIEPVKSFTAVLSSLSHHHIHVIGCFPVKKQKRTRNAELTELLLKRLRCTRTVAA